MVFWDVHGTQGFADREGLYVTATALNSEKNHVHGSATHSSQTEKQPTSPRQTRSVPVWFQHTGCDGQLGLPPHRTQKHPGSTHLGTSVREFLDEVNRYRKAHPNRMCHHPVGWSLRLDKKEKAS